MLDHTTLHTIAVMISVLMALHSGFKCASASTREEKDGWCLATIAWVCVVLLELFHHVASFDL